MPVDSPPTCDDDVMVPCPVCVAEDRLHCPVCEHYEIGRVDDTPTRLPAAFAVEFCLISRRSPPIAYALVDLVQLDALMLRHLGYRFDFNKHIGEVSSNRCDFLWGDPD